jgi:hypothetical protein
LNIDLENALYLCTRWDALRAGVASQHLVSQSQQISGLTEGCNMTVMSPTLLAQVMAVPGAQASSLKMVHGAGATKVTEIAQLAESSQPINTD